MDHLTEAYTRFEEIVTQIEAASLSKLFGKPCGKIGGKAFVAFFQEAMVFKIGRGEVPEMLEQFAGSENWDPSGKGRPMKDWVQVPYQHQASWPELAEKAVAFL